MKSTFSLSAWLPAVFALGVHASSIAAPVTSPAGLPVAAVSPADAAQSAPTPAYRSAFVGYRTAVEPAPPSEQTWRAANESVGNLNGHAGHMNMKQPDPDSSNGGHAHHVDHGSHHLHGDVK